MTFMSDGSLQSPLVSIGGDQNGVLCGQQRRRRFAEFSSQAANRWASANAGWRLWGAVTIGPALTLSPIIHLRAALSKIQHWCRAAEMQVLE